MPDPTDIGTHHGIGARIADIRSLRGYSLRELGKRAHVSASMLSRIESGDRYPSEPIIAAVARALGVDMSTLRGQPYIHTLQQDQLDQLLTPSPSRSTTGTRPPTTTRRRDPCLCWSARSIRWSSGARRASS